MSTPPSLQRYRERQAQHEAAAAATGRGSAALAQARLAAFATAVAAGVLADYRGDARWWWAAAASAVAFLVLVRLHARVKIREQEQRELAAIAREGGLRVERRWSELPPRPPVRASEPGLHAEDLDLFGGASLAQLLGPPASAAGESVLDEWLLSAADEHTIARRQQAVRSLVPLREWREELALRGRRARNAPVANVAAFLEWAESPPELRGAVLSVWPWVLPALLWLPLLATLWLPLPPLWIAGAAACFLVASRAGFRANAELERAFGREGLFEYFPALFATIAAAHFEDPTLQQLQQRLRAGELDATQQLLRLRRIMALADARYASMHFVIQYGFLWDLHVLRLLERWREECGSRVRDWLRAAGELETLARFATLADDEPDWCFPQVSAGQESFAAEALAHPLLPADARVANDVRVGPPGTFLLITGSNMSGKSTLLRAIGTNAVLALAGAPCCARTLRLPPLTLGTSIRVQDSLSRGISYFMAELERLKQVVDAAKRRQGAFLYLLDEVLHGTNTAERRIAARSVIAHLVAGGAIGAVTTHDLDLAASDELEPLAVPVHFSEYFERDVQGRGQMRFDYRLRPGLATSTNALRLMELVGLTIPGARSSD